MVDCRRIYLWGGTFDPPHMGHVLATQWLLATQPCDEVWWVPVAEHAWGKFPLPFEERVALCKLALESLPDTVSVCEVEAELPTPSRTFRTMECLQKRYPNVEFVLAMGEDVAATRNRWHRWKDLEARWSVVVVPRHGGGAAERFALPKVSSNTIREALASSGEDFDDAVGDLLPRRVLARVRERGWYREPGEAS